MALGERKYAVHTLVIALLVLLNFYLRFPSFDLLVLNPDEAQYAASASYLISENQSPNPSSSLGATIWLFKMFALEAGQYEMMPLRLLVLAVSSLIAVALYFVLSMRTSSIIGAVGALIFLFLNLRYEGFSVNREWFSLLFLVLAFWMFGIFVRSDGNRAYLLFVTGLTSGFALLFKYQSLPMVAAIPLTLPILSLASAMKPGGARYLLVVGSGIALVVVLSIVVPNLVAGSFGHHLDSVLTTYNEYVSNDGVVDGSLVETLELVGRKLYLDRPERPLLTVAYSISFASLAWFSLAVFGVRYGQGTVLNDPIVGVGSALALAALISVSLGQRFFDHYFQFVAPWVALLNGYFVYWLLRWSRLSAVDRGVIMAIGALLLLDILEKLAGKAAAGAPPSEVAAYVVLFLVIGAIAAFRKRDVYEMSAVIVLLVYTVTATVVLTRGALRERESVATRESSARFANLARAVEDLKEPGDRLFVWGWAPEIYSATKLSPGSSQTICQYLVLDYKTGYTEPSIDQEHLTRLMSDLRGNEPKFIVDASKVSYTMYGGAERYRYQMNRYPGFELQGYINDFYRFRGEYDDVSLFVRAAQ